MKHLETPHTPVAQRAIGLLLAVTALSALSVLPGATGTRQLLSHPRRIASDAPHHASASLTIPLTVRERAGIGGSNAALSAGVPLPASAGITDPALLWLADPAGRPVPAQLEVRARWGGAPDAVDRSIRWLGVDWSADLAPRAVTTYTLHVGDPLPAPPLPEYTIEVRQAGGLITVDTGRARFVIDATGARLLREATVGGVPVIAAGEGGGFELIDAQGKRVAARPDGVTIASAGPESATLVARGAQAGLNWTARLRFRAGSGVVWIEHTLHNPAAAVHPDNVWELGSTGSVFFEGYRLRLPLTAAVGARATLRDNNRTVTAMLDGPGAALDAYQDSSGGEHWQSANHLTFDRRIPVTFHGYRVRDGGRQVAQGLRLDAPWVIAGGDALAAGALVPSFWENFPQGIGIAAAASSEPGSAELRVDLFPAEFAAPFELQGGEQKTHAFALSFGSAAEVEAALEALRQPPMVHAPAAWYFAAGGFPRDALSAGGPTGGPGGAPVDPRLGDPAVHEAIVAAAVRPTGANPRTLLSQREPTDEYGWRNFGDVMADFETECGPQTWDGPISHYNNQYDTVFGAHLQWARQLDADPELADLFWKLAAEHARHTADIDVYHTDRDTPLYNHGLFWHTTHDTDADLSTHRTYPNPRVSGPCTPYTSGGPALGHLYAEGLVAHFWLTGDPVARDAALEMADFAVTRFGLAGAGDGRELANTLTTLVIAFEVSGRESYLAAAERIVRDATPERRPELAGDAWSTWMFLKALGRYLDLKIVRGEGLDDAARTARASLAGYADRAIAAGSGGDALQTLRLSDGLAYACRHRGGDDPAAERRRLDAALAVHRSTLDAFRTNFGGTYLGAKPVAIQLSHGFMLPALLARAGEAGDAVPALDRVCPVLAGSQEAPRPRLYLPFLTGGPGGGGHASHALRW